MNKFKKAIKIVLISLAIILGCGFLVLYIIDKELATSKRISAINEICSKYNLAEIIHTDDYDKLLSGELRACDKIRSKCPICGTYVIVGAKYCSECGSPIIDTRLFDDNLTDTDTVNDEQTDTVDDNLEDTFLGTK